MEISQKQINDAYAVASPEQKKVLDALFGKQKDTRPVIERIKTLDDAINELGEDHPYVLSYRNYEFEGPDDITAYLKLRIIVAAINEGWEPKFVKDECRWAPYFVLYTNDELDKMNEKDKAKICRVVGRSVSSASAYGGLAYAYASYASSHSYTGNGSRLAFKNEDLAKYAGQQFIEIYRDFMIQLHE